MAPQTGPRRMTGQEFYAAMRRAGIDADQFCSDLTWIRRDRVMKWCRDEEDVPIWVPPFLAMMAIPDAKQAAFATAASYFNTEDTAHVD